MESVHEAKVIPFPLHRTGTLEETLAGFPHLGEMDLERATRVERRMTVLYADVRGWSAVATRSGLADARAALAAVNDAAVKALSSWAADDVTLTGESTQPVLSATFEGDGHALRALGASVAVREAVVRSQLPTLPGHRFQVCIGVNTDLYVEIRVGSGAKVAYQSVGTLRMFAQRLQEFAGPGQIFLSSETCREASGAISVRSIGEVRTNGDGETREAYCLTEILPHSGTGTPGAAGSS